MATYAITIGGVTKRLKGGLTITETANGRNKLSAAVYSSDGSYRPAVGDEVLITENGTRIFGGNIDTPGEMGAGGIGRTPIVTNISAVDFNALADRRIIAETIVAGTLKAALIRIATYLSSYGVTLDAAQATGPTLAEIPFDYVTITAALNQLSTLTNGAYVWEIDYTKTLRMALASGTAAPFNVVDGDGNAIGDITVEPSSGFYANRVIVRFSAAARTAYAYLAATGTFANGEQVTVGGQTYTLQTVLVNSADNVLIGVDQEATLNNLVAAITAGPGAGTVYGTGTAANASATAYMVSAHLMAATALTAGAGGNSTAVHETCANASWITEGGGTVSTFQLGADAAVTSSVQANDLTEQGLLGLWEQVISEPSVFDATIAQALADGYLAQAIAKPKRVRYRTAKTGIHPGMTQTITIATRNLTGTYIVTDVSLRSRAPTYVEREVIAVGGSNLPARWQDDARRLFAGTGGGSSAGGGAVTVVTGGGVTGSGTANTLAKWTSTTSAVLGDSVISESGSAVTVAGTLTTTDEISVSHASPSMYLSESGAGSNLKNWRWNVASQVFQLQTVNDARSSVLLTALSVSRSTGALTIAGGLTAGSGAVGIINSSGKIPALTSTYFTSVSFDAANLTGTVPAATLTGRSLADLGTRSAADLSSGNLAYARMPSGSGTWTATPTISGDTTFGANAGTSTYVSQTTGWRGTVAGSWDVRDFYTDALHAKSYIADLEQATAGSALVTKGVAVVASAFTVPAAGAAVSSITRVGSTATVTTASPHGFSSGDTVSISGAVQPEYNVTATVTVSDTTHFTVSVAGSPATPATGTILAAGASLLVVEDLPGAADMQVFAAGDAVVLRSFSRAGGALTIGDAVGVVLAPDTSASGTQTWTFVRTVATPGSLARGTVIAAKSLALDYGVSGNGYIESTAIDGTSLVVSITRSSTTATVTTSSAHGYQTGDVVYISGAAQSQYNGAQTITVTGSTTFTYTVSGSPATPATGTILVNQTYGANAPYVQIVTWATAPVAANKTLRTRFGNIRGVTGTLEYGLFAGDYANKRYVRLTDQNAELVGLPLLLYDGATNTVKIDPTVPSIALGSTLPSAYGTGTGIWMGKDSGAYKFRVGNPSGEYFRWDGTNIAIVGGGGNATIDSTGVTITAASGSSYASDHAYRFTATTTTIGMGAAANGSSSRDLLLQNLWTGAGNITSNATMQASGGTGGGVTAATFSLTHTGTASSASLDAQTLTLSGSAGNMALSLQGSLTISSSGFVMGAPTGGNKGAGTINIAGDIYKNNTAYTNPQWALKHYFTGAVDTSGPYEAPAWYTGLCSIDEHRAITRATYDLPLMREEQDAGLCRRGDLLLASVEEAYLYIYQLHDRIAALEAREA